MTQLLANVGKGFSVLKADSPGTQVVFERTVIAAVIVAALYFGRELFVPLAVSVLLAFALSPVVRFLTRKMRLPRSLAVTATVLMTFAALFAIGAVITSQVSQLGGQLPSFQSALKEKVRTLNSFASTDGGAIDQASNTLKDLERELSKGAPAEAGPAATHTDTPARMPVEVYPPPPTALEQIENIIAVALAPLATAGIILVFVIFLLLQQHDVRDRAIRLVGSHDLERTTVALDDAGQRLGSYFLTLVVMNAGFGAAIGMGLWFIGIPNAILWGILAMLMRFMPMVGVFIAAAIPVILAAAVDPGWTMLALVVALYLAAEGVMSFAVEPLLQSSSTGLSTMAILVAAAFWTLLWGPIGLVLAVPLTAVLVVVGRHVEGLNFLHVLLGDTPPLTPDESFYQRMLAGDPEEATEQAEQILKEKSLTAYYDDVALVALRHAQIDSDLEKLEVSRLSDIRDAVGEVVDTLSEIAPPEAAEQMPQLPEEWRRDGAILCIAGQSALDESGALILRQLLQRKGFSPRVVRMSDLSSAQVQGGPIDGAKLACISMFDIENRGTYLKFLVRRARRVLPGLPLLGGFWKNDPNSTQYQRVLQDCAIDLSVNSMADAIAKCEALAKAAPAVQAAPARENTEAPAAA